MLFLHIVLFAILIWLGLYMLNRDIRNPRFILIGTALILTSGGIGARLLVTLANSSQLWMWGLHGIGLVLAVLAIRLLKNESRKEGVKWLPDLMRSFDYSFIFTLIFSGQVALVIWLGAEFSWQMLLLLLISIVLSIAFQVFVYPIHALVDRMAFAAFPKIMQSRTRLRLVDQVQVHIDEEAKPDMMSEEDLLRHTKGALRNFGDLQRLASNPLTQLKLIDRRLSARSAADEVIERAVELKAVLQESILQLKPRDGLDFGTTDEWRYYNVLYFPYIVGIKPFSVRYSDAKLDASSREALAWFRTNVPERTYYNWQNAGAKLVAMNLREQMEQDLVSSIGK